MVASGVSGGMAWAVLGTAVAGPVGIAAGVAVGAAVLGAKVISGVLLNRDVEPLVRVPAPARPPRGSVAAGWLERAERAVRSLDELAATAGSGPLAVQVEDAVGEARGTLAAAYRLAAQLTAVEQALVRADAPGLDEQARRLADEIARTTRPAVLAERERSAAAVRESIAVRERLRGARATLLARLEAVTFGLEGLVARLAEVLALSATSGGSDDPVDEVHELALELEGLRAGLAETEQISQGALAAAPPVLP